MSKIQYFKKCNNTYTSVVDALKSVGVKQPTKEYRQNIAKINGIKNYSGTASQNLTLLNLLKKGQLIKSIKEDTNGEKFVKYMNEIHNGIKQYGTKFYYSYINSESTFDAAIKKAKAGKKTGITCVVPTRWGMKKMGVNPSGMYGKNGKFSTYTDAMKKSLTQITTGSIIGLTIKQAVDKKLLKPGDIIVFSGKTHTVSYTGNGYTVFDGGSAAQSRGYAKVGIILDYSVVDKNYKISGILRWK